MSCHYNLDWGSVPAWLGLLFSFIGSIFLILNYRGEKKKRRLALRPFFTIKINELQTNFRNEVYANKLVIENIGEIAVINYIEDKVEDTVFLLHKIAYSKNAELVLTTKVENIGIDKINFVPQYDYVLHFEDIEGRFYIQRIAFIDKSNRENRPELLSKKELKWV